MNAQFLNSTTTKRRFQKVRRWWPEDSHHTARYNTVAVVTPVKVTTTRRPWLCQVHCLSVRPSDCGRGKNTLPRRHSHIRLTSLRLQLFISQSAGRFTSFSSSSSLNVFFFFESWPCSHHCCKRLLSRNLSLVFDRLNYVCRLFFFHRLWSIVKYSIYHLLLSSLFFSIYIW